MPRQTVIYLGPAGAGKTHEMVRLYREALRRAGPNGVVGRALWLAPTSRNAASVREQLLADGLDACLAPRIVTFEQLTDLILATGPIRPAAGLTAAMQREVLRRVIAESLNTNKLIHFADAARRSGFVDLAAEHIRELNRYGVGPAAYAQACSRRDRAAEHRELAILFAAYEQQLVSHRLADSEGRHAAARDALAADACPRLQNLEIVAVDGFTDFTHTQHELLRLLANRSQRLFIALPYDSLTDHTNARTGHFSDQLNTDSSRPDLFAKINATIAELRHFHPQLELRHIAPRPLAWAALDHLAQHIFRNPRQVPPLPAAVVSTLDRLEIVAAASAHDEIVQIARRIKKRLAYGEARPGDIVVVFRSLKDAAPRIREVLSEFGIPHALETGLPLAAAAVLRTLLSLLRLDAEDWPFRRVVAALTNNTLTAIPEGARQAAEWLVRDLQIAKGREALVNRVEQLAEIDLSSPELSEHAERRSVAAKAALPALRVLATALSGLANEAPPLEWRDALVQLGMKLGLAPFMESSLPGQTADFRQQLGADSQITGPASAWHSIDQHFIALERLDASLGESPRRISRRKLLDWLLDLTQHESLPRTHDDVGRVRVLSAATGRTITAKHLYLAGMSEQAFPSPERAGGLSSADEYQFLSRAADQEFATNVPLDGASASRSQEEMLLFYEVITRAEESLTISYPALDDKAQQLPPSPYVTELLRTLGRDNEQHLRRAMPQLSPIPPADTPPLSVTDWRVQAIAQAVGDERDQRLLAGIFRANETKNPSPCPSPEYRGGAFGMGSKALAAALEAGLRITHARQRRDEFGPAEGLLTSPAVAARLATRFGPKHLWSPSQWEKYAACPYKFYLEEVLGLEPLGDLVLETDHRRRGSLLHHVLAKFHRKFGVSAADAWTALQRDEVRFVAELKQTLQDVIAAMPRDGIDAALLELDHRQIDKWTDLYRGQHEKYDAAWSKLGMSVAPAYFELRFGPKRRGESEGNDKEDPHSINSAFQIDIGGEIILVTGRIDRIDVGRAGDNTVFNVIDYKSGQRPSLTQEKIETGERLQPALYVMAAEALLFGADKATPVWAGYWSMKGGVTTDKRFSLQCSTDGVKPADDWSKMRAKIIRRIGQLVAAIRRGEFPVSSRDPDCTSRCEFNTVCRISQIRSLGKSWEPELEASI